MPRFAVAGVGPHAEMFHAASRTLGWDVVGDPLDADVAVVDGALGPRRDAALALLARGVGVVLAPGLGVEALVAIAEATERTAASVVVGEPFPTAPAVQRWFADLDTLGDVGHLSGRAARSADSIDLVRPLLTVLVLAGRVAGWGDPGGAEPAATGTLVRFGSGATATLRIDEPDRAPHWELQAASPTGALRLEMLPRPVVERDGRELTLPPAPDPADAFGAAPLLRTFRADLEAGRRPVLGPHLGLLVERLLRDGVSRAG